MGIEKKGDYVMAINDRDEAGDTIREARTNTQLVVVSFLAASITALLMTLMLLDYERYAVFVEHAPFLLWGIVIGSSVCVVSAIGMLVSGRRDRARTVGSADQ